jgi:hypothetical protein
MSDEDFDPLEQKQQAGVVQRGTPLPSGDVDLAAAAEAIQAKADAFRHIADRFYVLWWNLPEMSLRQIDRELQDLFRMYMDLAPSLGVSRNTIPELRECCGRKRSWKDGSLLDDPAVALLGAHPIKEDAPKKKLGWGLGDLIARVTRVWKVEHCDACELRRLRLNSIFPPAVVLLAGISLAGFAAAFVICILRK